MNTYYGKNRANILQKYHANFIKMIEYQLSYYYTNRLERIQYQLKYHNENYITYLTYQKSYYEKNKERLLADRAKQVLCSCGKKILKGNFTTHQKTNLHKKLVNIQNKNNNINSKINFIIENADGTTTHI